MDILIGQLKNLILPVAVVLTSGENKMLAFTLLTPFLIDFMIFVLKRLYIYTTLSLKQMKICFV